MTSAQKLIKIFATALAVLLCVSILYGAVNLISAIVSPFDSTDLGNTEEYSISNDIVDIEIEIPAADIRLIKADEFLIKSNLKRLKIKENGKSLTVSHPKGFFNDYNEKAVVEIQIPDALREINIEMGAGKLTADSITTDELQLELGAGSAVIKSIYTHKETEIEGGAGEIKITDSKLTSLDANMGVGKLTFSGTILKNAEFDMGVGDSNITLIGAEEDYRLSVNKGIGDIKVKGHSVTSGRDIGSLSGSLIEINGGIGDIAVDFKTE